MDTFSKPLSSLLQKRIILAFIIALTASMMLTGLISLGWVYYQLGDRASINGFIGYEISILVVPLFLAAFVAFFYVIANALIKPYIHQQLVEPLRHLSSEIQTLRFDDFPKAAPRYFEIREVEEIYRALESHISNFHSMYDKFDALMMTEHKTGLLRRVHLDESLRHEVFLAQRFERIFSIMVVKLTQLKDPKHTSVEKLQGFTQELKTSTRNTDMLFYINDHLFILVAPQTDCDEINVLANELALRIQRTHRNEDDFVCHFEVGCATYGEDQGTTPNELLHSAMRDLHQVNLSANSVGQ